MQYSKMIELMVLADGKQGYIVNRYLGKVIIFAILAIILIVFFLLINNRKKAKAQKISNHERQKIQEEYKDLEVTYEDIVISKNQLGAKYDELKLSADKVKKLAYTDYLTELPNRLAFKEILDSVMMTLRNEEIVTLMEVDIDNFKSINDTLGHSYGDELLIDVTHRLRQVMDENDYLARTGGDEFIILSQNIEDTSEYESKVKKIQKVFSYPFVLSMKEYFISVSIGIVMAPKDGKTTQVLIKNVNSAMNVAKDKGKNTYFYFDESINEKLMERIQRQSELRKAMDNNEFIIYYQPQVDLSNNKITGFEALVRWEHPTKGILSPKDFLSLAEETGLIVPIGDWILKEVCRQLKQWNDEEEYQDLTMSVNITPRQFKDLELVNTIQEIIGLTDINPNHLVLEITEPNAISNVDYTIEIISQLKELGVKFTMDNFGGNCCSISYLKRLPMNYLKIDRSIINTMLNSIKEESVTKIIISLAHTLNMVVIAEGVEYNDQEAFLKEVMCDRAQGYLFGRPVPKEEAIQLLHGEL